MNIKITSYGKKKANGEYKPANYNQNTNAVIGVHMETSISMMEGETVLEWVARASIHHAIATSIIRTMARGRDRNAATCQNIINHGGRYDAIRGRFTWNDAIYEDVATSVFMAIMDLYGRGLVTYNDGRLEFGEYVNTKGETKPAYNLIYKAVRDCFSEFATAYDTSGKLVAYDAMVMDEDHTDHTETRAANSYMTDVARAYDGNMDSVLNRQDVSEFLEYMRANMEHATFDACYTVFCGLICGDKQSEIALAMGVSQPMVAKRIHKIRTMYAEWTGAVTILRHVNSFERGRANGANYSDRVRGSHMVPTARNDAPHGDMTTFFYNFRTLFQNRMVRMDGQDVPHITPHHSTLASAPELTTYEKALKSGFDQYKRTGKCEYIG
jgi:hypothetical protein